MINEIKKYKISLAGIEEKVTLSFDFKALIKMSKEYGNAYQIIGKFLQGDMSVVPALIRCTADVELTEEQIEEGLAFGFDTLETISEIFNNLINAEMIGQTSDVEEVTEKN